MASSLLLQIGPDLSFRLENLPAELAEPVADFFRYYLRGSCDTSGMPPIPIVAGPLGGDTGDATPILKEPPLQVRKAGSRLLFELPGVVCWCDTGGSGGGIAIDDLDQVPVEHLTGWVLVAMLFQLARHRGWLGVHAGAVVAGKRAIVLPGPSGCGKTTIFRNAATAGLGVLSDDLVWLREADDRFQVVPFPKGTGGAVLVPTHRLVDLGAIVFPTVVPESDSRLRPVAVRDAVGLLADQCTLLGTGPWIGEQFAMVTRAAAAVPCFTLAAGSDQAEVPRLLRHGCGSQVW